jgi:hypothetical protein
LFNGTQLLNSVKDGNNLIEYANDYTEQIGAASKDAMSNIKNLVVAKQYETMPDDGSRVYTTAENDYLAAVDQYKENLENSDKIDALLNESTFQRYIDSDENYNSQKHDAATKDAIIEQLIIKEFPMYTEKVKEGKTIRSAIGDKKQTTKLVKQPSAFDIEKLAVQKGKLNLEKIKLQRKLEEELAPKFKNKIGDKYDDDATNNFLSARKKYSDIKIAVNSMREFKDDEGNFTKEGITELDKYYPGIVDQPLSSINTASTLQTTLAKMFLPGDKEEQGIDYNTFIVMNKDYENFLKEQESVPTKGMTDEEKIQYYLANSNQWGVSRNYNFSY